MNGEPRLSCVILNYNDAETVTHLLAKIKNYAVFDRIVIVDGASTDDSFEILKKFNNEKIEVIKADKNGGYGYGNNFGIKYSRNCGMKYVLVANPDVSFEEKTISEILKVISNNEQCVAVAPRINSSNPAIKFSHPVKDALFSCMFLNKIFRPRYYPLNYFKNKNECYVDALPGSLVLFDIDKFYECGLYDEDVFLYHEEIMIGKSFLKHNYKSILYLNGTYQHFHSISVKKAFKSVIETKKITMDSHKIYLEKYCNCQFASCIVSCLRPIAYVEAYIWNKIKKK